MVESPKGCVLQWTGHADYVTERFSGLLARQALVDVTLVCEEEKLRVHKLVLASNSTYFEEILQQDLGYEPIIFLKDLEFTILKAMIEFMYCGETTISYQLLPSLLAATKTFKVKQLATVIDSIMTSNIVNDNNKTSSNVEKDVCTPKIVYNTQSNEDDTYEEYSGINQGKFSCKINSNHTDTSENQSSQNATNTDTQPVEVNYVLYAETQACDTAKTDTETSLSISNYVTAEREVQSSTSADRRNIDVSTKYAESNTHNNDTNNSSKELQSYEQISDLPEENTNVKSSVSPSQSCLRRIDKSLVPNSLENSDIPNKMGKCVKVYSHKRRRSVDEIKNKLDMKTIIPNPPSTDCIDLLDEPPSNDIPVTLLTSLDIESAEYIISLSTEHIQTIVGATVSDQCKLVNCGNRKEISNSNVEKISTDRKELSSNMDTSGYIKPILRRSLRLLQQENEDITHQTEPKDEPVSMDKHLKKSVSTGLDICGKGKRKVKDVDYSDSEHNINNIAQSSKRPARSPRNNSRLLSKRNSKSNCGLNVKDKEEQKMRTSSRVLDVSKTISPGNKLHTIERINRALWGDMSDIPNDYDNQITLDDYTPHTEIPFAVGLLPLRTALEKMQATPDYQPRKTRSSVAPLKCDSNNLKRKNYATLDSTGIPRKQHFHATETKGTSDTVCHIQIRTAPSQYIRNRRKFLATEITTAMKSCPITNL